MVSCRRCSRTLTYPRSIRHGCGSFCYYKKGCPPVGSSSSREHHASGQQNTWKKLTRGVIVGVALGVSCALSHVVCLAVTFIGKHETILKGAGIVFSSIKSRGDANDNMGTIIEESGGELFNKLTSPERDLISDYLGTELSKYALEHHIPERISRPIAEETTKSVISTGSNIAFNWGSRILMR